MTTYLDRPQFMVLVPTSTTTTARWFQTEADARRYIQLNVPAGVTCTLIPFSQYEYIKTGADDLRESLARVLYAALFPDASDTFDHPELEFERNQVRRMAHLVLNSDALARVLHDAKCGPYRTAGNVTESTGDYCYQDWDTDQDEHTCGEPKGHDDDHRCLACGLRLSNDAGSGS